jgi:hypothetical protein
MNITKDLGSLISGLFAPQASSPAQKIEQGGTSRSRTATREQAGNREKTGGPQGSDRLTLSSESISLANVSRDTATSAAVSAPHSPAHPSERLALPYSPSATSSTLQQTGEESPTTRHLVRAVYGSNDSLNTGEAVAPPNRIDFHA